MADTQSGTPKLGRQLSLVSYLLAERRPVTATEIRRDVGEYGAMPEEVFARRLFADCAELEAIGVGLFVDAPQDRPVHKRRYAVQVENLELQSRISEVLLELLSNTLRRLPLTEADVAVATATDSPTVAGWIARRIPPTRGQTALIGQLLALVQSLEVSAKPEALQAWLTRSLSALNGRSPLETLAIGGYRLVAAAAQEMIDLSA